MRKSALLLSLLATMLVACGSDSGTSDDDAFKPPSTGGGGSSTVSSLSLVTSSPTLPSDGATTVEITAFVRNAANQFVANVPVTFSADSGGLLVSQGTTDSNGIAKATLSAAGDKSNRTIAVTAIAGAQQDTVSIGVSGTTLSVQGPANLTQNQQGTYTVSLLDAGNNAIPNRTVAITSARSNPLNPANVTTDSNGRGTFVLTASNASSDTLTAAGQGVSTTYAVAVNSSTFSLTMSPTGDLPLGQTRTVTVSWPAGAGMTVRFSTTRGTINPASVVASGAGVATATIQSTNAGPAIITAQGINGSGAVTATGTLNVEFVATTPTSIDLQPSQFTVQTGQSSTITAVIRDAAGNLVKNQVVTFTLNDVTGGSLSTGSAVTDSQGRAQTVYTASSTTSANNGVQISATLPAAPAVPAGTVALTVAGRQVFISLGTGNELTEPDAATYNVPYRVFVTDANGVGVANVPVSLRILSVRYYKGVRVAATAPATGWNTSYSVPGGCVDEDVNRNATLDVGEDINANGTLEAGNIATVSSLGTVTGADGSLAVTVAYPQEYAYYLDVALSASATVQGTEYVRTSTFRVPGISTDFNDSTKGPPGPVSPFGTANSCANPL